MPCPDSEHNVTIVDKRIEDADNVIPVHHVIYRIEYGVLRDIHSETVYYRCEVGKRYHVLIQCDGVWKSWSKIDE
jgi:hypothetical protein